MRGEVSTRSIAQKSGQSVKQYGQTALDSLAIAGNFRPLAMAVANDRCWSHSRLSRVRAPFLVGAALSVIAALPWLSGPMTGTRILGSVGIVLLASVFLFLGRPRRHAISVDFAAGWVRGNGQQRPLTDAREFVLTTAIVPGGVRPRYAVALRFQDDLVTLYDSKDPAEALEALRRLSKELSLPVKDRWGLGDVKLDQLFGAGELRSSTPEPAARPGPKAYAGTPYPDQGRKAVAVFGSALFLSLVMTGMYTARVHRGAETMALSLILSVGTVALVLLIGAGILSQRVTVTTNGTVELVCEVFGISYRRRSLSTDSLRRVFAVGLGDREIQHLVFVTTKGCYSIPWSSENLESVASALQARSLDSNVHAASLTPAR